jgi:hypothetical protein
MNVKNTGIRKTAVLAAAVIVSAASLSGAVTYPWKDEAEKEEMLVGLTKYFHFFFPHAERGKSWDDLQVLIIPEYTLDGDVYGYISVIAFDVKRPPSLEDLFARSEEYYAKMNEAAALAPKNADGRYDEEIAELEKEQHLAVGDDLVTGESAFSHFLFCVNEEGADYAASGGGLPREVMAWHKAKTKIQEQHGVSELKFVRYVVTSKGHMAEFESGGKRYFGPASLRAACYKAYAEEDIPTLREGFKPYRIEDPVPFTWEAIFLELIKLKDGTSDLLKEEADAENHKDLVPNYPDNDPGYGPKEEAEDEEHWGCGTASLAAIVMYEKVRYSGTYGEEYWPYTPKYEPGWGEKTEGRKIMAGMNDGKGTSPLPNQKMVCYINGMAHIAYSQNTGLGPWYIEFEKIDDVLEGWLSKHFTGGSFSASNSPEVMDLGTIWSDIKNTVTEGDEQTILLTYRPNGSSSWHGIAVHWCTDEGLEKLCHYFDADDAPSRVVQYLDLCTLNYPRGGFTYISSYPGGKPAPAPFFDYASYELCGDGVRVSWSVSEKDDKNVARYEIFSLGDDGDRKLVGLVPAYKLSKGNYEHALHINGEGFSRLVIETQFHNGSSFEQGLVEKSLSMRRR